jgi:hypothetical protein
VALPREIASPLGAVLLMEWARARLALIPPKEVSANPDQAWMAVDRPALLVGLGGVSSVQNEPKKPGQPVAKEADGRSGGSEYEKGGE